MEKLLFETNPDETLKLNYIHNLRSYPKLRKRYSTRSGLNFKRIYRDRIEGKGISKRCFLRIALN